jgi:hypothetical protein
VKSFSFTLETGDTLFRAWGDETLKESRCYHVVSDTDPKQLAFDVIGSARRHLSDTDAITSLRDEELAGAKELQDLLTGVKSLVRSIEVSSGVLVTSQTGTVRSLYVFTQEGPIQRTYIHDPADAKPTYDRLARAITALY